MEGLIYDIGDGRRGFIQSDSIIAIKEKTDYFEVWFAKGYTNANAKLSKDELVIRNYTDYLAYYS